MYVNSASFHNAGDVIIIITPSANERKQFNESGQSEIVTQPENPSWFSLEYVKGCGVFEGFALAGLAFAAATMLPSIRHAIFDRFDSFALECGIERALRARHKEHRTDWGEVLQKRAKTTKLIDRARKSVYPDIVKWERIIFWMSITVFILSAFLLASGACRIFHYFMLILLAPVCIIAYAYQRINSKLDDYAYQEWDEWLDCINRDSKDAGDDQIVNEEIERTFK